MSKTEIDPTSSPCFTNGTLRNPFSFIRRTASPIVAFDESVSTIGDAVRLMHEKGFRNVPLVAKGELVGSISVFDIITYLAECYPKETMNLPPLPAQVMDSVDGG